MSDWKRKRFWKKADVGEVDDGFAILLDGKSVRTPAKAVLKVPTRALAEAIAAEWDAQEGDVDPNSMPITRSANAAIDKVGANRAAVVEMLAEYGDSDLLCYRAEGPQELVLRQSKLWDPMIDWAHETFGVRLNVAEGVMHVPQPKDALSIMASEIEAIDNFALAGFHDLVGISGSLVLALAVQKGRLSPDEAWALSRVDETWQVEQWGEDDEATAAESVKRDDFLTAARVLELSVTRRNPNSL